MCACAAVYTAFFYTFQIQIVCTQSSTNNSSEFICLRMRDQRPNFRKIEKGMTKTVLVLNDLAKESKQRKNEIFRLSFGPKNSHFTKFSYSNIQKRIR